MSHLLVKVSRKFAEKNTYTKLKAMMVLNTLAQHSNQDLVTSLASAIEELRNSVDDKVAREFFALQGIEEAAVLATTAEELEAVHLTRLYTSYVFALLHAKQNVFSFTTANFTEVVDNEDESSVEEHVVGLVDLLQRSVEISACASHSATPLNAQCRSIVALDQKWIVSELQKGYEKDSSSLTPHLERVPDLRDRLVGAGFAFSSAHGPSIVSAVADASLKNNTVERAESVSRTASGLPLTKSKPKPIKAL